MIDAIDRENARNLAKSLVTGFVWGDTKDGRFYWEDVVNRLLRISNEGY